MNGMLSKITVSGVESVSNTFKNLVVVLISIAVALTVLPPLNAQLKSGKSKLTALETPLVKVQLANEINTPDRTLGVVDVSPPAPVATAAQSIDGGGAAWCYVGAFKDGQWKTRYFDAGAPPKAGDSLRALADANRRADKPIYDGTRWKMGDIEGLVSAGQKVHVDQVAEIPGVGGTILYWIHGAVQG